VASPPDIDRSAWRRAESFEDLCALGERFVSGALGHFPGWGAPDLDEESDALVEELTRANRGGFLTTASQPGRPFAPGHDGRAWAQRAFVCGFAREATHQGLIGVAAPLGLWCISGEHGGATRPLHGASSDAVTAPIPVGLADGVPYLFAGHDAHTTELELFAGEVGAGALRALAAARFVWLVDPVWGRRDALRAALDAAFA
jgi:hypothetical protein